MSQFQSELQFSDRLDRSETNSSTLSPLQIELADLRVNAFVQFTGKDNAAKRADVAEAVATTAPPKTAAEMVKDVAEKFDKATDKNQAMKELREQFNEAIKKSDEELEAVKKKVLPLLNGLANEMAEAFQKVNPAVQAVFDIVEKSVPEASRREIQQKIARYLHMPATHNDHAKLRAEFAKYPGMTAVADVAARELKAAQPIFRRYNPPAAEFEAAGHQAYFAREEFAKRLEQSGSKDESEALRKMASHVLTANPDPAVEALWAKENLKKSLKQLENPFPKR